VYELKNGKSAKSVERRGAGRTIGDLCEHYLRTAGNYDAEKDKYSGGLHETAQHKRYVAWWTDQLGHMSLADIDQFDIKDALRTYLSEPRTHYCRKTKAAVPHNRKRKASSRNRLHAALRRAYNFAKREGWVTAEVLMPAHQVSMPKEGNERKRGLDVEQVKALLQACKDSHWNRMHLFISGLATTGARKNEWPQMEWRRCNISGQYALCPAHQKR
jgi:site-specific recombinase XerD